MFDCLMLDIGGTFVKCGAMQDGAMIPLEQFPMPSMGTKDEILEPLFAFLDAHPAHKLAVSIPGPMDYDQAISWMKHKFAALYGLPLKEILKERYPAMESVFVHDGAAYALGELTDGGLTGCSCGVGIMLGTGLGFVLIDQGKLLMRRVMTPAYPLWSKPYGEAMAESYVSGTAIRRRWTETGHEPLEVKEIADLARAGNTDAAALFRAVGEDLGKMLTEHLIGYQAEKVVVGGQIAKSLDLMRAGFESACTIPLEAAAHIGDAALRGAYAYAQHGKELFNICAE